MHLIPETSSEILDPASRRCLDRTRGAVLNVLLAIGLSIAISGWALRSHAVHKEDIGSKSLHVKLMIGLVVLAILSFLSRRLLGRRVRLKDPGTRAPRFFWSHLLPAVVAALAAPLGLLHGWLVDPGLESVGPFWVVALALGFLALPREHGLNGFAQPIEEGEGSSP
jgi:hypothetical protein